MKLPVLKSLSKRCNCFKSKATIPIVFTTNDCGFYHQYSSVSSPLLLRNSPQTFAFIPISPMCLSSQNRSIYQCFRHILPYSAEVYKGLNYSKTGVPWQTKSTFIIVLFLLVFLVDVLFC